MSDKSDPDFDDIDAYLGSDGIPDRRSAAGAGRVPDADIGAQGEEPDNQSGPTMNSPRRLVARAAHAIADLKESVSAQTLNAELLAMDQQLGSEISTELDAWDAAVDRLEALLEDSHKVAACRQRRTRHAPADDKRQSGAGQPPETYARSGAEAATHARVPDQAISSYSHAADAPVLNRIVIAVDGRGNLKFPLDKAIVTIGRKADNDIHIRSRFISRYHARIVSDTDGAIIEDIDSRNGVSVNSERVHRRRLRSGDLIDIGQTQLKFIDLGEDSAGEGNA